MPDLTDVRGRRLRLTKERVNHLETDHPEMREQFERIAETVRKPEQIVESRIDQAVELYYRLYTSTPVTMKYLCVVVKDSATDGFVLTAYFTDTVKKGRIVWQKK